MAFEEVHGLDLSDTDIVRVFKNKDIPVGVAINAQFLREYKDGSWKLNLKAGTINFFIELPEYEAKKVIEDSFNGYSKYECKIVSTTFEPWDFS